ncbi:MAG: AmmeMemoRadiSam system protein B [Acidobacteria bacterium]|nr:MAG: AmmeMemoRadiSam system protein B [Acidobacteriota bacterium]
MRLAALRPNLDLVPSPLPDRPGLLVRDPFRYAEAMIVIPSALVPCLAFFNGRYVEGEVSEALQRLTGDARVGEVLGHLARVLSEGGFLDDENFGRLRTERHRAFAEGPRRDAAHAGAAYPAEQAALRKTLDGYLTDGTPARAAPPTGLVGIAAPHVSPEGGWRCYQAAYAILGPEHRGRTVVILGTSHYGEPDRFGLTRKAFLTPLGEAEVDVPLVDELVARGGEAMVLEDYCHAVEHSIEFQVVFLQHVLGPDVRILPVLCGPFAGATRDGGRPEDDPGVARVLDALGDLAAKEGDRLLWVLGVDMAHVGRRYGDDFAAQARTGSLVEVEARDRRRCEAIGRGDAGAFWELLRENGDDLRWCGASPFYAFLKALPGLRCELLIYEQWNIDEQSVVSFGGLAFSR